MTIAIDVLGFRYDDTNPAFTDTGNGFYLHWAEAKMYDKKSFDAWMTANTKSFGSKELGQPSAAFLKDHRWGGIAAAAAPAPKPPAAPTLAPITISITKAPSNTADDVGTVTVAGGPADKAYTVTLTVHGQGSAGDDVQNVSIPKSTTAAAAAGLIAAASSDPNVTAAAAGAVITFTPKAGTHITKLTVSIA